MENNNLIKVILDSEGFFMCRIYKTENQEYVEVEHNEEVDGYLTNRHKLIDGKFVFVDIEDEFKIEQELSFVRKVRDIKLQQCDWTQLPDVPLQTKELWAIYRQALRDITQQPDPFNITWPEPPSN